MAFYRFVGHPGKYNKLFNRWRLEEVSNLVRVGVGWAWIWANDCEGTGANDLWGKREQGEVKQGISSELKACF